MVAQFAEDGNSHAGVEPVAAALRTRALWTFRRLAPPVDTVQRQPGSAPQVGHCTAADELLLRRGCRHGPVVVVSMPIKSSSRCSAGPTTTGMATTIVSLTTNGVTSGSESKVRNSHALAAAMESAMVRRLAISVNQAATRSSLPDDPTGVNRAAGIRASPANLQIYEYTTLAMRTMPPSATAPTSQHTRLGS